MSDLMCPWCGKRFGEHDGRLCPVLDNSLTAMIRAALASQYADRRERASDLALNRAVTPRLYPLTNAAGSALKLLSFDLDRGIAVLYNDDAADVWLGTDKQHIEDATKRFPLKAKGAIAITSPAELWAFGNAVGPQNVFVMELPPGCSASEAVAMLMQTVGVSAVAAVTAVTQGYAGASAVAYGTAAAPGAGAAIATLAAPGAGTYEITATVGFGAGAPAAGDLDNFQLRHGATVVGVIPGPFAANTIAPPLRYPRVVVAAAEAITINAIGAGTAGLTYRGHLIVTQVN